MGVTVEGNAITCDGNHEEPVVLVVPDVSARYVVPARVRSYAHPHAWTTRRGEDYCPSCSQLVECKIDQHKPSLYFNDAYAATPRFV